MSRMLSLLLVLGTVSTAQAQDRFIFGYTHTDDGPPPNAVELVTDQGIFGASLRGWLDQTGFHHSANDNYLAGRYDNLWYRNFFLFDLGAASTPFVRATLRLYNPSLTGPRCYGQPVCNGYQSPNPSDRFFLRYLGAQHYANLYHRAVGRTDLYAALGSGQVVGQVPVTMADNGTWVTVDLNQTGIDRLNAYRGLTWGVGGALDDTVPTTVTPEPATIVLTATGLLVVGVVARRRREA